MHCENKYENKGNLDIQRRKKTSTHIITKNSNYKDEFENLKVQEGKILNFKFAGKKKKGEHIK